MLHVLIQNETLQNLVRPVISCFARDRIVLAQYHVAHTVSRRCLQERAVSAGATSNRDHLLNTSQAMIAVEILLTSVLRPLADTDQRTSAWLVLTGASCWASSAAHS